jgi:hypothetical protein
MSRVEIILLQLLLINQYRDLPAALRASEEKSLSRKAWRSEDSSSDPSGRGINGVLDEEVGYELSTREILD